MTDVRSEFERNLGLFAISVIFGALVRLGALDEFSAVGLKVASSIFPHSALIAMSASGFLMSISQVRLSYARSLFSWHFQRSSSSRRAALILRYPFAFWYFNFYRHYVGFPRFIFPTGSYASPLISSLLILLAIMCAFVGVAGLWGMLAYEVWSTNSLPRLASHMTLIGSFALVALSWTAPQVGAFKSKYVHYGLSERLASVTNEGRARAYERISRAAERMGLIKGV
jgi:hypothetical protein